MDTSKEQVKAALKEMLKSGEIYIEIENWNDREIGVVTKIIINIDGEKVITITS